MVSDDEAEKKMCADKGINTAARLALHGADEKIRHEAIILAVKLAFALGIDRGLSKAEEAWNASIQGIISPLPDLTKQ